MMSEDEMKDEVYRQLQEAMDGMSSGHPKEKAAMIVATNEPTDKGVIGSAKAIGEKVKDYKAGNLQKETYLDPKRNDIMNQIEGESKPASQTPSENMKEGPQSMLEGSAEEEASESPKQEEEEDMPKGFGNFVRSRRRG